MLLFPRALQFRQLETCGVPGAPRARVTSGWVPTASKEVPSLWFTALPSTRPPTGGGNSNESCHLPRLRSPHESNENRATSEVQRGQWPLKHALARLSSLRASGRHRHPPKTEPGRLSPQPTSGPTTRCSPACLCNSWSGSASP